jgi:hypothetical protein
VAALDVIVCHLADFEMWQSFEKHFSQSCPIHFQEGEGQKAESGRVSVPGASYTDKYSVMDPSNNNNNNLHTINLFDSIDLHTNNKNTNTRSSNKHITQILNQNVYSLNLLWQERPRLRLVCLYFSASFP